MHPHYGADTVARTLDTIADALQATEHDRLIAVDRHGRPYNGSGILVPFEPTRNRESVGDFLRADLARMCVERWITHVASVVTSRPAGLYFGARRYGGTLVLDVVQAFSDAEEAEAHRAARARGVCAGR